VVLTDLLKKDTELLDDCRFCQFSQEKIAFEDSRGAVNVYKTGSNMEDWYAMLQSSVTLNPTTGFRLLLLPMGHISSFAELKKNRDLAGNYGRALADLSYAMQKVREEEWPADGPFRPSQIVYAKCLTPQNTQEHLHFKLDEPSAGLAQAFPADAGWVKKDVWDRAGFVGGKAVSESKLSQPRVSSLAERLIEYSQ
jgi:hypothetical protein